MSQIFPLSSYTIPYLVTLLGTIGSWLGSIAALATTPIVPTYNRTLQRYSLED